MSDLKRLKPANRHLVVIPHICKNETNSGVLLPEEYKPEEDRYIEATVVDIAEDCHTQFRRLKYGEINESKVVVDRTMLEEIRLKDRTHYLILENYVVGFYTRPDAN